MTVRRHLISPVTAKVSAPDFLCISEVLMELARREKEAGIKPDPEIDMFMKATAFPGQGTHLMTDCVLKIRGLEICADTVVGNKMKCGVSGGLKKGINTGDPCGTCKSSLHG